MTEIISAQSELLDLAAAMRPDWDRDSLSGALTSAKNSGWPWPKAFLAVARLLADPDGGPRDLLAETRSPVEPSAKREPVDVDAIPEVAAVKARFAAAAEAKAGDAG